MKPTITHLYELSHLLAISILVLGSCAAAGELEQIKPPVLRDVMWQLLPEEVEDVYVGPDGRIWWQYGSKSVDCAQFQRSVEREFTKDSPVFAGARIALFEPSGRVWFVIGSRTDQCLLGYDGEEWIKHSPIAEKEQFTGHCPNHASANGLYNVLMRGFAFFATSQGVHSFHIQSRAWSYLPTAESYSRVRLLPEPDREGLLILTRTNLSYDTIVRRIVKNGIGGLDADGFGITVFDRGADGKESVRSATKVSLVRWTYETAYHDIQLRKDMASDLLGPVRAGRVAGRRGFWVNRANAIDFIPYDHQLQPVPNRPIPNVLGDVTYGLLNAQAMHQDSRGNVYILVKEAYEDGQRLGKAIVVARPDGTATAVLAPDVALQETEGSLLPAMGDWLELDNGRMMWLCGGPIDTNAALLDVQERRIVRALPPPWGRRLLAVCPDGTLFGTIHARGFPEELLLFAYRSHAQDDREILETNTRDLGTEYGRASVVASDGLIWSADPDGAVVAFDGQEWHPVDGLRNPAWFIPGNDGGVLAQVTGGYALVYHGEVYAAQDLRGLIEQHRSKFVDAFRGVLTGRGLSKTVIVDGADNVWLLSFNSLAVLVGDKWVATADALLAACGRKIRPAFLTSVEGSRVYVSDFRPISSGGCSFYGEVKDGLPVFTLAPHVTPEDNYRPVHDTAGALWIPAVAPTINGGTTQEVWDQFRGSSIIQKRETCRLTKDGVLLNTRHQGWPILCDKSGNVWLQSIYENPRRLEIYSHGEIAHTVSIPYWNRYNTRFVSDRPGSVYVWTPAVLVHLVACDPARPGAYETKRHYWTGVEGRVTSVDSSDLGYLVVRSEKNRRKLISLVRIPPDE